MGDNVVLTEQSTSTWSGDENSAKPISVEKLSGSGDISISFTDGTRALYIKSISVTYTESSEPQKNVKSLAITGEPAQTEYTEGETFSAEGLTVTATYDDASTAVVTADANWTFEPATLAVGTTSVTATATYNEKTASETYNVTVKEIPSYTYTWMVNGAEVKK
ncbi:MAG: bacterial Ig-like domain-containing protein, partial [Muribaculaceae bacterium]|nr:bacterial Ig-like domain-containing protein [Muribaculaceae bacterium]